MSVIELLTYVSGDYGGGSAPWQLLESLTTARPIKRKRDFRLEVPLA
jgi:hypothetical protein